MNRFAPNVIDSSLASWFNLIDGNWRSLDGHVSDDPSFLGTWGNGITYNIGERLYDQEKQQLFICLVSHVSSMAGTFEAHRIANPTHWQISMLSDRSPARSLIFDETYVSTVNSTHTFALPFPSGYAYDIDIETTFDETGPGGTHSVGLGITSLTTNHQYFKNQFDTVADTRDVARSDVDNVIHLLNSVTFDDDIGAPIPLHSHIRLMYRNASLVSGMFDCVMGESATTAFRSSGGFVHAGSFLSLIFTVFAGLPAIPFTFTNRMRGYQTKLLV